MGLLGNILTSLHSMSHELIEDCVDKHNLNCMCCEGGFAWRKS